MNENLDSYVLLDDGSGDIFIDRYEDEQGELAEGFGDESHRDGGDLLGEEFDVAGHA